MRNKIIFIITCVLLVFSLIIINATKFNNGYKITITNNTNENVSNLELRYKVGSSIQTITEIQPHKTWEYKIDTNNIQGENAIILTYKDKNDNSVIEYVVGYLEKGYEGKANVVINKIDINDKLDIEVK